MSHRGNIETVGSGRASSDQPRAQRQQRAATTREAGQSKTTQQTRTAQGGSRASSQRKPAEKTSSGQTQAAATRQKQLQQNLALKRENSKDVIIGKPIKKLKVDFDDDEVKDAVDLNDALADLFEQKERNNESVTASIQAKIKQQPPIRKKVPQKPQPPPQKENTVYRQHRPKLIPQNEQEKP